MLENHPRTESMGRRTVVVPKQYIDTAMWIVDIGRDTVLVLLAGVSRTAITIKSGQHTRFRS